MPLKYNPLLEENFQELNPAGAGGSDLQSTLLAGNITGGQSIVLSGSDAIKSTNSQLLLNDTLGAWSTTDSEAATLAITEIYKAGSDGFVIAWDDDSDDAMVLFVETGDATPDITRATIAAQGSSNNAFVMSPVKKDDYWQVTCGSAIDAIYWLPFGSGTCVKQ